MEANAYKVVKIFRISRRRKILHKNLSIEEAKRIVATYKYSQRSMVVFTQH